MGEAHWNYSEKNILFVGSITCMVASTYLVAITGPHFQQNPLAWTYSKLAPPCKSVILYIL